MRSVIGTAPSMLGPPATAVPGPLDPAALSGCAGAHPAMIEAATVPPVVQRNARRVGIDGLDEASSGMEPPFGMERLWTKGPAVHRVNCRAFFSRPRGEAAFARAGGQNGLNPGAPGPRLLRGL